MMILRWFRGEFWVGMELDCLRTVSARFRICRFPFVRSILFARSIAPQSHAPQFVICQAGSSKGSSKQASKYLSAPPFAHAPRLPSITHQTRKKVNNFEDEHMFLILFIRNFHAPLSRSSETFVHMKLTFYR